jgi:hypothetical protein
MIVRQSCAAVHCYHIAVMLHDSQCGVAEVFSLGLVWENIQHPGYD